MARAERVAEVPVAIDVNDARLCRTTCSPDRFDALVAGRLAADGFIASRTELLGLEIGEEPAGCFRVRARVDPATERRARDALAHCDRHGCGVLGAVTCVPAPARRVDAATPPDPGAVPALLRALTAAEQAARGEAGGMHGCAVVVGGELRHAVFDVGRHSAMDKAIGTAVLADLPLHRVGLVTTARISGEMAAKGARAGVAWLASRSIATSLALAAADAAGLPIIVRGGTTTPRLHTPAGRA